MSPEPTKNPERIRSMFDEVAGQYDFLNRLLSLGLDKFWRQQLVNKIPSSPVVDIACGSGDVLRRIGQSGYLEGLTGVDFSREMLALASLKLREQDFSTQLVQGDALSLPFGNSTHAAATCAFGVRNFANRRRAFSEVERILSSDGRFAILEFFPPRDTIMNQPIRWYLGSLLPTIGGFFSEADGAYDYLSRSINNFIPVGTLEDELISAGFQSVSTQSLLFGLVKIVTADKDGE